MPTILEHIAAIVTLARACPMPYSMQIEQHAIALRNQYLGAYVIQPAPNPPAGDAEYSEETTTEE